jgi:cell division protease FtsH
MTSRRPCCLLRSPGHRDRRPAREQTDRQQLTQIARQMVGRWGMSDKVGPITVLPTDGNGPFLPGASETSPQTQYLVDQEVRRLVDESHAAVTKLLSEHRDQLETLARALIKAETLDAADAYAGAQMEAQPEESELAPAQGGVA